MFVDFEEIVQKHSMDVCHVKEKQVEPMIKVSLTEPTPRPYLISPCLTGFHNNTDQYVVGIKTIHRTQYFCYSECKYLNNKYNQYVHDNFCNIH